MLPARSRYEPVSAGTEQAEVAVRQVIQDRFELLPKLRRRLLMHSRDDAQIMKTAGAKHFVEIEAWLYEE